MASATSSATSVTNTPEVYQLNQESLTKHLGDIPADMKNHFIHMMIRSPLKLTNENLKFIIEAAYSCQRGYKLKEEKVVFEERKATLDEWGITCQVHGQKGLTIVCRPVAKREEGKEECEL